MRMTIDGIAASGKSSVAKGVAVALGIPYISSGFLYRAATYVALERQCFDVDALLPELGFLSIQPLNSGNTVLYHNTNITPELETVRIDSFVSQMAQHPLLRSWVNERLQQLPPPFVAEGRDMGSVVFPEAEYKFFLIASSRVRADRRSKDRTGVDLDSIQKELEARDENDRHNTQPAQGAKVIDTSALTLQQVVDRIVNEVQHG